MVTDQLFHEKQVASGICCSISLRDNAGDNVGKPGSKSGFVLLGR